MLIICHTPYLTSLILFFWTARLTDWLRDGHADWLTEWLFIQTCAYMHRVLLLKKTKHLLHCALPLSYTMVCCQNLLDSSPGQCYWGTATNSVPEELWNETVWPPQHLVHVTVPCRNQTCPPFIQSTKEIETWGSSRRRQWPHWL